MWCRWVEDPAGPSKNAKARYFDPKLGRFLTQDSYLGEIDEPPSLHRYLYANANPTTFVDPTGHFVQTPASVGLAKAIEAGFATATPAVVGVGTAVVSLGATAVLAVGGVTYAALKANEAVDELEASTAANERMRRQHHLIIEQQREMHAGQTAQAKAKAGASTPQQGTLILEDEDANEVLGERRRRAEAQKSGVELGQAKSRALPGGAAAEESDEQIGELQRMARQIQAAHKNSIARDHSVTAAGRVTYGDGRFEYWVSSSEDNPRSEHQELIKQYGAKVIRGKGDAEVTLVNAYETARKAGIDLKLEEIGTSSPTVVTVKREWNAQA